MSTDIINEIDGLQRLTTGELADRYEELHGQIYMSPLSCTNRHHARGLQDPRMQNKLHSWQNFHIKNWFDHCSIYP